jgi:esterase/lipase
MLGESAMHKKIKKLPIILGSIIAVLLVLFFAGPRITTSYVVKKLNLPDDLDLYLKTSESMYTDITPNTEKIIIWAGNKGEKTPVSLVYLHGYTATRQEVSPVMERVAKALGANIFFTRFTGHGRGADAMAECSLDAWINDVHEAWEIGKRIGGKVIVVGTSTGASLSLWLASQKPEELECLILISANIKPADQSTALLALPWGNLIVKLAIGDYFAYKPANALNKLYWTTRYKSEALLTMMSVVELGKTLDLAAIKVPSLWIYTEKDKVVSIPDLLAAYERIGSAQKKIVNVKDAKSHVLAGDVISPEKTDFAVDTIITYLEATFGFQEDK